MGRRQLAFRFRAYLYTGNAGFWAPATAEPELGLFYIPTESSTSDYYGGYRPGHNLYANSIVALVGTCQIGPRTALARSLSLPAGTIDPDERPLVSFSGAAQAISMRSRFLQQLDEIQLAAPSLEVAFVERALRASIGRLRRSSRQRRSAS